MTLKEIAPIINLDLERVVALFMGKEEMYIKFLKKFPDNAAKLLTDLHEAVKNNDHEKIEAAAHGMKGVAGNLGVQEVINYGTALMLDIRNNTPENIPEHYQKVVAETEKAITYIEKLD